MDREAVEAFLKKIDTKKMETAFKLVDPRSLAEIAFNQGKISKTELDRSSCRDEIDHTLTDADLEKAGVTLAEVVDAVVFYTGEVPSTLSDAGSHRITGCGYRRGGCGDH